MRYMNRDVSVSSDFRSIGWIESWRICVVFGFVLFYCFFQGCVGFVMPTGQFVKRVVGVGLVCVGGGARCAGFCLVVHFVLRVARCVDFCGSACLCLRVCRHVGCSRSSIFVWVCGV